MVCGWDQSGMRQAQRMPAKRPTRSSQRMRGGGRRPSASGACAVRKARARAELRVYKWSINVPFCPENVSLYVFGPLPRASDSEARQSKLEEGRKQAENG